MSGRLEWYSASVVIQIEPEAKKRKAIRVWENVYVVHASSFREAKSKAARLGKMESSRDMSSFEFKGEVVRLRFVGVRKVVRCLPPFHGRPRARSLEDGAEVSYSTLKLADAAELKRFMTGEPVRVQYEE